MEKGQVDVAFDEVSPGLPMQGSESEHGIVDYSDFFREEYARVVQAVYVAGWPRSVAQDSSQEAFVRAYLRWSRLAEQPWAAAWVVSTALNCARRSSKRERRDKDPLPLRLNDSANQVDDAMDVRAAVRGLPLRQRQAVVLYYLLDYSTRDVSRALRCSEGSVKTHLSRARSALAVSLSTSGNAS